jgi:hypothetical protein
MVSRNADVPPDLSRFGCRSMNARVLCALLIAFEKGEKV